MKSKILSVILAGVAGLSVQAQSISYSAFGPHGEGGTKNGQNLQIGSGGSVFELDAFLQLGGLDLNGAAAGTTAQLSRDALPAGLSFAVVPQLTPDKDLVLTYIFTNLSASTFTNVQFLFLLDAEIDQELNTFFNEHGVTNGAAGQGAADLFPDRWQIDEPGFAAGTLFNNLYAGTLNNSNSIPAGSANDVAMALGFELGDLLPGNTLGVAVEISGRGNSLGPLRLVQQDPSAGSTNTVTLSGLVATLAGTIFRDFNRNGSPDLAEGLPGVKLVLSASDGAVVAQVTTDANGNYSFGTPPAGTYSLKVDPTTLPPGLANTVDPDGTLDSVTTTALAPGVLVLKNWGYQSQIVSGLADVTALTKLGFQWRLNRPTGSLLGSLSISNLPSSGAALAAPFRLGLPTSTNYWLARPAGQLDNGVPYVDITTAVNAALGTSGALAPGKAVTIEGVEIYSRDRSAPPIGLFELWSAQTAAP